MQGITGYVFTDQIGKVFPVQAVEALRVARG
jgi:hypothetical protein